MCALFIIINDMDLKTKYPIVFVRSAEFSSVSDESYWGHIPEALEARGASVFKAGHILGGTMRRKAGALISEAEEILKAAGEEKVNIIAHSEAGIYIRLLAATPEYRGHIASLTSIAVPHWGLRAVDDALKSPHRILSPAAVAIGSLSKLMPDFKSEMHELSADYMGGFNRIHGRPQDIFTQSYAFIAEGKKHDFAASGAMLSLTDSENDGFVSLYSALWGSRCITVRGPSHFDAIDFGCSSCSCGSFSDIYALYFDAVSELKKRGL